LENCVLMKFFVANLNPTYVCDIHLFTQKISIDPTHNRANPPYLTLTKKKIAFKK